MVKSKKRAVKKVKKAKFGLRVKFLFTGVLPKTRCKVTRKPKPKVTDPLAGVV